MFRKPLVLAVLLLVAATANASFFVVPPDDDMIDEAQAIVIGTIRESYGAFDIYGRVQTTYRIEIEEVLKGNVDTKLPVHIRDMGGVVGSQGMLVPEAAQYWNDNRALIFLDRDSDGWFRTYGLAIGKFDFVTDAAGRKLSVRWLGQKDVTAYSPDGHPHEEKLRSSQEFIDYIRHRVSGQLKRRPMTSAKSTIVEAPVASYFVEADLPLEPTLEQKFVPKVDSHTPYPPTAYTTGTYRWKEFDSGGSISYRVSGSQPGLDSTGAASRALAAWTNDPDSNIRLNNAGTTTAGFVGDGQNTIVFNSANDVPAGNIGYAAYYFSSQTHPYDGITWRNMTEGDVVIKSNFTYGQTVLDEAVTHELGHTLGFRHSDEGTPSSTNAVMKAVLNGNLGASLAQWDRDAAKAVYGGPVSGGTPGGTTAPPAPNGVNARAITSTVVQITWNAVSTATSYQVQRSTNNVNWTLIATVASPSHTDTVSPNTTYRYRVIAVNSGGTSPPSTPDHATTVIFTNDPLMAGVIIRAVHLTELRTAVNAMRVAAGLAPVTWTDPNPVGVTVKAIHIIELRNALIPALTAFGRTATFSPVSTGTVIRANHFQEIREAVK